MNYHDTYRAFFVIGCPRSGTTALIRVLQQATNAAVHSEQAPKLCLEAGDIYHGVRDHGLDTLESQRSVEILKATRGDKIYGDKNPNYLAFLPGIAQLWGSKVVLALRDGRDVVRSIMDWHDLFSGNIYTRIEDDASSNKSRPEDDYWDYARLRPAPGTETAAEWRSFTRFQKCAWMWANYNRTALDRLALFPSDRWRIVRMNENTPADIAELYDLLGLEGFSYQKISEILNSRVNSVESRTRKHKKFPSWNDWSDEMKDTFDSIAGEVMTELGFYHTNEEKAIA